jgi:hypothetical protein
MRSQSAICPGKNTSEVCYQAIKRVGALCNVCTMQPYITGFRSFLRLRMVIFGAGVTTVIFVSRRVRVNGYVFEVYRKIDPHCVMAPENDPWLLPVTGDGTRVSYRGKSITMCGVKQADVRLSSQHETGKTMNQSRHMYIPALAGYTDEASIMPYFEELLRAFREIEERGCCVVDQEQHKVHIRAFVVGDLAFEQKYLKRGAVVEAEPINCHKWEKVHPFGRFWTASIGVRMLVPDSIDNRSHTHFPVSCYARCPCEHSGVTSWLPKASWCRQCRVLL